MSPAAGGRPRDPAIDAAVLTATVELLREDGYGALALEKVAALAGTSKAAIRRRWPQRQRLVIDALASVLVVPPAPDNGCTRCDLHQSVRLLAEVLHERLPAGVLAPLIADCSADPGLHEYLLRSLVQPGRAAAAVAVRRAVERGDLQPDVDPELFVTCSRRWCTGGRCWARHPSTRPRRARWWTCCCAGWPWTSTAWCSSAGSRPSSGICTTSGTRARRYPRRGRRPAPGVPARRGPTVGA